VGRTLARSVELRVLVEPVAKLFARLEERDELLRHRHRRTGPRITALPSRAVLHGKSAETAKLDAVALRQRIDDLVELLIRKHLIMFSELPAEAQEKLIARKRLRAFIHDSTSILDDTEIL